MQTDRDPTAPIGMFDSGLGGLSVLREVQRLLPAEDILYVADSAYCPYGNRTPDEIRARGIAICGALIERGVKLVIVACNTACSVAIEDLRRTFPDVPIVGLEPAVKPAVRLSRSGRVAVIATPRTVAGRRLADLVQRHAGGADVRLVPAAGWVELVEAGQTTGPQVEAALEPVVRPLVGAGVDTLVLGCTHYPFLRGAIAQIAGPAVTIVDSGEAIARRTRDVLAERSVARSGDHGGTVRLFTTGVPEPVSTASSRLLDRPVEAMPLPV